MAAPIYKKVFCLDFYGQPVAPAAPPAGTARVFYDSANDTFAAIDSTGANLTGGTTVGGSRAIVEVLEGSVIDFYSLEGQPIVPPFGSARAFYVGGSTDTFGVIDHNGNILLGNSATPGGRFTDVQKVSVMDLKGLTSAPPNPPYGFARMFYNATADTFNVIDSNGNSLLNIGYVDTFFNALTGPSVFAAGVNGNYDAFPGILTLPNGNMLVMYRAANTHLSDKGVLVLNTSTNNGATWTAYSGSIKGGGTGPTGTAFSDSNANYDYRDQVLGLSNDGNTIFCFWNLFDFATNAILQISYSTSTNGGASWSTPAQLTATGVTLTGSPTVNGPYFYGPLINIPSGESSQFPAGALAATVLDGTANADQWMIFSTNNGVTWGSAQMFSHTSVSQCAGEIALVYLGGNELMGFGRNNQVSVAGTGTLQFMYSTNLGQSWTISNTNIDVTTPPGTDTLSAYELVSPWLIKSPSSDGKLTLAFGERTQYNLQGGGTINYSYLRTLLVSPSAAIANPTGFGYGQSIDTRSSNSSLSGSGYPGVANTSNGSQAVFVYYAQPSGSNNEYIYEVIANYDQGIVATPTFSPVGATYVGTQTVTITSFGADTIYYTTDGSTPTTGSSVYSTPISVTTTGTVKALAVKAGFPNSSIGSAGYTIIQAPTLIAHTAAATSGSGNVTSSAINTTNANFLVAILGNYAGTPAIVDSKGNTWQALTLYTPVHQVSDIIQMFYCYNPTVGTNHTFSNNGGAGSYSMIAVAAFNNMNTTSAVFETGSDHGAETYNPITTVQPGSVTPQNLGDLIISGRVSGVYGGTPTVDSGFTIAASTVQSGTGDIQIAYLVATSLASVNPTWSLNTDNAQQANIAVFEVA